MATITSASTVAQIRAAYLDNLSYSTDGSVAKAKAFIESCRAILAFPDKTDKDGTGFEFDLTQIAAQLSDAQQYLSTNSPGGFGSVTHLDLAGFRD